MEDPFRIPKLNLGFGGMDIHVHGLGREPEEEDNQRKFPRRDEWRRLCDGT